MFKTKSSNNKKSEDVKKSAGKVLDTKKDTPTRAKVNMRGGKQSSAHQRLRYHGLSCPGSFTIVNIFSGITCAIKCSMSNCLITHNREVECNFLPFSDINIETNFVSASQTISG